MKREKPTMNIDRLLFRLQNWRKPSPADAVHHRRNITFKSERIRHFKQTKQCNAMHEIGIVNTFYMSSFIEITHLI